MSMIRLGSYYIPKAEIVKCEIRSDKKVRFYLREKIGPFRKHITISAFRTFNEANSWIFNLFKSTQITNQNYKST